jgi:hypothetical protein
MVTVLVLRWAIRERSQPKRDNDTKRGWGIDDGWSGKKR